ncbi:MAG: DUF4173 domain-containing protein [Acidobacteria bacterium]|nr:MAG: DUF4173 domain-containing protein [Acidobacteriota bacterium]REJ98850.1 MAG: DUF4173 domain-containing protein [Acidobacteriota bacterium]REK16430.1 MAG: DUF4173 domain-containing protein [Acidobacteriota bacterium]REK44111.1 MAG: DUF4173 domain-containing protein [Acidobacteriota bacterium]
MDENTKKGLTILIIALGFGILADSLLRSFPWGLNVPIMALIGVSAIAFLRYRIAESKFSVREILLLGAALFFSSWFAIRDSEPLLFLNVLAILLIATILFIPAIKLNAKSSGVVHYLFSWIAMWLSMTFLPAVLLTKDMRWNSVAKRAGSQKVMLAVRGMLIAVPLLLIFGGLFAAADAAFEGFVNRAFDVVPEELALHGLFTAFFAWPAAGYLRAVTLGVSLDGEPGSDPEADGERETEMRDFAEGGVESVTAKEEPEPVEPPTVFGERHIPSITFPVDEESARDEGAGSEEADPEIKEDIKSAPERTWSWRDLNNSILPDFLTVGSVEVGIVLGSLNLLFFLFVLLQLPYLFGGMDLVQNQPGLKLAEYARRGFGELFFASMLVLPILLALHWLIKRESERAINLFRYLAAIQIGLLFVIMMSAFQRMILYTGDLGYGMTAERFYPMAFMIWLAVIFLLFGYTVLRGLRSRFAWSASLSVLALVAVLNFVNPDDYIVRTNLELMREGRTFDAQYNAGLSADAAPALIDAFTDLNEVQQNDVLYGMRRSRCFNPPIEDLRVWNHSRKSLESSRFYLERVHPVTCSEFRSYGH